MRYSDRVVFVKTEGGGGYDPATGEDSQGMEIKTVYPCHVSGLGIEKQMSLFGSRDKEIILCRLLRQMPPDFDHVLYAGTPYKSIQNTGERGKKTLYLERVAL